MTKESWDEQVRKSLGQPLTTNKKKNARGRIRQLEASKMIKTEGQPRSTLRDASRDQRQKALKKTSSNGDVEKSESNFVSLQTTSEKGRMSDQICASGTATRNTVFLRTTTPQRKKKAPDDERGDRGRKTKAGPR